MTKTKNNRQSEKAHVGQMNNRYSVIYIRVYAVAIWPSLVWVLTNMLLSCDHKRVSYPKSVFSFTHAALSLIKRVPDVCVCVIH